MKHILHFREKQHGKILVLDSRRNYGKSLESASILTLKINSELRMEHSFFRNNGNINPPSHSMDLLPKIFVIIVILFVSKREPTFCL